MARAKTGDTVSVHYTGKLDDGTIFDTSAEREPLQFTIGENQVIPGFEQAVIGMEPGDSKSTRIPAEEAYGPHHDEMVVTLDKSHLPEGMEPEVEQRFQLRQPDGQTFIAKVTDIGESNITLDANHPLAGEALTFDIQLTQLA